MAADCCLPSVSGSAATRIVLARRKSAGKCGCSRPALVASAAAVSRTSSACKPRSAAQSLLALTYWLGHRLARCLLDLLVLHCS